MERTKNAKNYSDFNPDCSYHVNDHNNRCWSIHWNFAVYENRAGCEPKNGNRYVTFHQLSREQAQKLHEDDRVYDVGDTVFVGSTTLGNSSLNLYLREYHDNALAMYPAISKIKEGHLPE
ncbi:MAG: hypothetical protein V8S32_03865 [Lachnospiraceae bacterium]